MKTQTTSFPAVKNLSKPNYDVIEALADWYKSPFYDPNEKINK